MNAWPFVAAAYLLTLGGTGALALASWLALRRAEGRDGLPGRRAEGADRR